MSRLRDDRGVVAVETALVVPLLLALVGCVVLFGLRMWGAATVDRAAEAGVRAAVMRLTLHDHYPDDAAVRLVVQQRLGLATLPPCTVTDGVVSKPPSAEACAQIALAPGTGQQGDPVSITVFRDVPSVRAAARLVPVGADRLSVVRATASGRLE